MKKKQLKKTSKRRNLADQHRVKKKVREHHRKVRKEARKASKLGLPVKSSSKLTRIPNLFPGKKEIIEEHDLLAEIEKNRAKHSLISTDDLNNLVTESSNQIVQTEENQLKELSRYDAKRELNNIVSMSDIIVQVLDARDPLSYRSKELENNVVKNKEKRLIILINKVDLVAKENSEKWGKLLRRDYPTVLFSVKREEGMNELISIIKALHLPNKKIHIGFVGYPNTGKSSIIKLFNKNYKTVAKSTLIPGTTEIIVENNVRFFSNTAVIFSKNEIGPLMPKTTKDVENLKTPLDIVKIITDTISHDTLLELYEIADFNCHVEFLENISKNKNFKIKGGYLDVERAARYIIQDVIDGKIKYETNIE